MQAVDLEEAAALGTRLRSMTGKCQPGRDRQFPCVGIPFALPEGEGFGTPKGTSLRSEGSPWSSWRSY